MKHWSAVMLVAVIVPNMLRASHGVNLTVTPKIDIEVHDALSGEPISDAAIFAQWTREGFTIMCTANRNL